LDLRCCACRWDARGGDGNSRASGRVSEVGGGGLAGRRVMGEGWLGLWGRRMRLQTPIGWRSCRRTTRRRRTDPSPDALHLPAIRRHRGWAPELLILLRRRAGRRPLLYLDPHHSRPALLLRPQSVPSARAAFSSSTSEPRVAQGVVGAAHGVPGAAGLCTRGQPPP
jgi:hypothetical protein